MSSKSASLWMLARYENGFAFKPEDFGPTGTPVVRIRQLVDPDAEIDLTERQIPSRYLLHDQDLVFSWSGSLAVQMWDRGPAWLNQHLFKVVPATDVDHRWLRWTIEASIQHFLGMMHGSAMTHLTHDMLKQLRVLVPDLDEQRRIADFLDAETARIDQLAKLRASQTEALGLRYQSQLSKTAQELRGEYGSVKVRHVLQKIEQGWSPQCEDRPINEGEWGVVKAGCVNGGTFDPAQHKALPTSTAPELRYRLRPGDLLMSRASGSVDLIGSIAVLPDDLPDRLLLCDKVYRLRMDRTRMSASFVAFMLRTLQVREQIKLGISGAEGMANNLPTATITNLPLPDVPVSEQASVVTELENSWSAVQETRQKLREQLNVLAERRQALITAAVTGEITV